MKKSILASATLDMRVQRLAHVTLKDPVLVGYDQQNASAEATEEGKEGEGTAAAESVLFRSHTLDVCASPSHPWPLTRSKCRGH